jgi:azurin
MASGKNKAVMGNNIVVKKATNPQSVAKNKSAMSNGIVVKSATNPQSVQKNAKATVSPTKYKKA